MARLTDDDRELILADYHTGHYTIRELAVKHDVGKTTIANLCKDIEPKNRTNVDTLIAVHVDMAEQSGQEVDSIKQVVDKKTEHLKLINDNATLLANLVPKIVKTYTVKKKCLETGKVTEEFMMGTKDLRELAEANDKLAITLKVADRHAPKIDITQNQALMPQVNYYAPEKDKDK